MRRRSNHIPRALIFKLELVRPLDRQPLIEIDNHVLARNGHAFRVSIHWTHSGGAQQARHRKPPGHQPSTPLPTSMAHRFSWFNQLRPKQRRAQHSSLSSLLDEDRDAIVVQVHLFVHRQIDLFREARAATNFSYLRKRLHNRYVA